MDSVETKGLRITTSSARLVDKSLPGSHSALLIVPPKFEGKTKFYPYVFRKPLVPLNIVVGSLLNSHDSVPRTTRDKLPVIDEQNMVSRSDAMNISLREVKPIPSLMIWNLKK